MRVQIRLNAISPYQSQQSSPAIQDITVSGHTRHLRSGHTRHHHSDHMGHLCSGHTRLISGGDLHMQHSPLLLHSVEQETNKQSNKHDAQLVIPIVASLKPCLRSEQGKSTTVALNHKLTSNYHKPIAFMNFVCLSFISAFVSISATFSFVCT